MNLRYSMWIEWSDEDQAFIVTLPDFPMSRTHGSPYEEAVRNGQEVIELLVQTYKDSAMPLPKPTHFQIAPASP